ncbi:cupredoxin domain-containing protein [Alicyclobacillus mali (ex Roth et al. 2021)]|uniref:cupredoxin domain-containing protein n=1 Tax=Alicyclobacillus mali (ex Roth et al. 2021) TaxID=1123961 RepID=UPI001A8D812B|nr:cupredoxin domain-containing protein [Alicyclobacillus mali (ex Roth et al. 2021)]
MRKVRPVQALAMVLASLAAVTLVQASCAVVSARPIQVTLRDGGIEPREIDVTQGATVDIVVRNEGSQIHNFVVPDFYVFTQNLQPGETVTVSFVPDKTGNFRYYSDRDGIPEVGMQGTMKVASQPGAEQ